MRPGAGVWWVAVTRRAAADDSPAPPHSLLHRQSRRGKLEVMLLFLFLE